RHVHVEPEPIAEEFLRLLGVERLPLGRAEQPEALDVIGGELRGEECVRLAGDDGEEGADQEDQERGDGEAHRGAQPRARRGLLARERLTSGAQARRQRFGAEPIRARAQQLARAAFLPRDDATRRAGVEVALHLSALRIGEGSIGILRQQVADAAAVRFHRWLPALFAVTGTTGTDAAPDGAVPEDSFSKSIRRPREMRDITVPMGTLSISAISAYVNSSTSRSQTAWRKASGSSSSAACRSASSVLRIRMRSGVSTGAPPAAPAAACSTCSLSTSTASRLASRRRFRHVLWRMV